MGKNTAEKTATASNPLLQGTTSPALINYSVTSIPTPLQVSSSTPADGVITVDVADQPNVLCQILVISIPIGTDQACIYQDNPPPKVVKIVSTHWSASLTKIVTGQSLGLPNNLNYYSITLNNNLPSFVVTPFTLTVDGNVSTIQGAGDIQIKELSSPNTTPNSFEARQAIFTLTKAAPVGLYIKNFYCFAPGSPLIPASEFNNLTPFTLSWDSNGTSFSVYEKNNPVPIPGIKGNTLTYAISTDTTFILKAELNGAVTYDTITITVANPSLTPISINSNGLNVKSENSINLWSVTNNQQTKAYQNGAMLQVSHSNNSLALEATSGSDGNSNADAVIVSGNNLSNIESIQLLATSLTIPSQVSTQAKQPLILSLKSNQGGSLHLTNTYGDNSIAMQCFSANEAGSANALTISGMNGTNIPAVNINSNNTTINGNLSVKQGSVTSLDQVQANYATINNNAKVSGTLQSTNIQIGAWYISVDGNGNLNFGHGKNNIKFNTNGTITQNG